MERAAFAILNLPSSILACSDERDQRLRRSRRAVRFLLPPLRRRRGLAMRVLLSSQINSLLFGRICPPGGRVAAAREGGGKVMEEFTPVQHPRGVECRRHFDCSGASRATHTRRTA